MDLLAPTAVRVVQLPDGRALTVRTVRKGDIPALQRLYDELPDEDRYRRFFSLFRPGRRFFDKLVTFEERGGLSLVVEVAGSADDGETRLIAEADYSKLPNGNGEFAITVAADWRGWLGPFLLDVLVSAAAERGIPNLEADILTTNGPMLAVVRARGCVSVAHPDWTVARVAIGAADAMPRWPAVGEGPRVLVEVPGARWRAEELARASGYQVLECAGPDVTRRCPVLAGRPCPLAAEADVVVMVRPRDNDAWRALASAHHDLHPGVPVCVEARGALGDQLALIDLPPDAGVEEILERLAALVGGARVTSP